MTLPVKAKVADIVLEVEFDPIGAAGVYTKWCGATNANWSINNEIISEKTLDCTDYSLPVAITKNYAGQDVKLSIDGTWAASTHKNVLRWALDQESKNVRISYLTVAIGEPETVTGVAMLGSLNEDALSNTEGNSITRAVELEINGGLTVVDRIV